VAARSSRGRPAVTFAVLAMGPHRHEDDAPDGRAANTLRQAISELTSRAVSAGTVNPGITADDVITLISAMRGLIHTVADGTSAVWQRFLDIHVAGMTAPQPRDDSSRWRGVTACSEKPQYAVLRGLRPPPNKSGGGG
jgi:hypothetical protein